VDELWQRYRTFWIPVLIGLGVFLVGLIVVFTVNDDPDDIGRNLNKDASRLKGMTIPARGQADAIRRNAESRRKRIAVLAQRLDQTGLAADPVAAAAAQALEAAILRGGGGPAVFDGDAAQADAAQKRYERTLRDRVDLLKTGDPNVGFSRVLNDVWSEMRVRANRADVDLNADQLGFGAVATVNRSTLLPHLLNLALVARVADLAIRSGVRSIEEVRFEHRVNPGPDAFLREWPLTVTVTGEVDSFRPLLAVLTSETRTTVLGGVRIAPAKRAAGGEGIAELSVTAWSVAVRPDATLDLPSEEEILR
jgi:hypothetical protein